METPYPIVKNDLNRVHRAVMAQAQGLQDHPVHKVLDFLDIPLVGQDTHKDLVFRCRFSK